MNHRLFHKPAVWGSSLIMMTALLACTFTGTATPTPNPPGTVTPQAAGLSYTPTVLSTSTLLPTGTNTPEPMAIVHTVVPGELPLEITSQLSDRNSSTLAAQKRASGGDNPASNLYERPFSANNMDTYFPNLDITEAKLYRGTPWTFVSISLAGQDASGGLTGIYGVEFDLNMDGRGDVLLTAENPAAAWSTDGVRAFLDGDHDVGSTHPLNPDAPLNGDGYETVLFDQGVAPDPDLAWARRSPTDPDVVEFAFKRDLVNLANQYMWNAWAMDASMFNPAWFDFNDHFTVDEMGSPLVENPGYPIKSLAEVDNTCRWVVGFTPGGSEPGLCLLPPPIPGKITGRVFNDDVDKDGVFGPGSYPYQNIPIEVHAGTCSGDLVGTTSSNSEGYYSITVQPGKYCVEITNRPDPGGAAPRIVTVPNGGTVPNVDFAFWSQ
jgi:hypothetical protein